MTELFSTKCNSALRVARARPRGTGDTSGTLRGLRGGRERPPGGPTELVSAGLVISQVGLTGATEFSDIP